MTITYAALLGMLALAGALAFGLGGRDVAARLLEDAYQRGQDAREQARQDVEEGKERAQEQVGDAYPDEAPTPATSSRRSTRKAPAKTPGKSTSASGRRTTSSRR